MLSLYCAVYLNIPFFIVFCVFSSDTQSVRNTYCLFRSLSWRIAKLADATCNSGLSSPESTVNELVWIEVTGLTPNWPQTMCEKNPQNTADTQQLKDS